MNTPIINHLYDKANRIGNIDDSVLVLIFIAFACICVTFIIGVFKLKK